MGYKVNVAALNQMAEQAQERQESRANKGKAGKPAQEEWLKLSEGDHTLRIAWPWDERGLTFAKIVQHRNYTNDKGWLVFPISYDQIFSESEMAGDITLAEYFIRRKLLNEDDYQLYRQYGDPLKILPKSLVEDGYDKKEVSPLWPRIRHLINIAYVDGPDVDEAGGTIKKFGVSDTLFRSIIMNVKMDPTIVDEKKGRAFMLSATGPRDKSRRYSFGGFLPTSSKLDLNKGEAPFDLLDEMTKAVYHFDDLVNLARTNHTDYTLEQRLGDLLSQ